MTLPSPEEKHDAVRRMFDRIAPTYDRMNRLMTFGIDRRWRRLAVDRLELEPGARVLDLACGTGDLTAEASRGDRRAIGVDYAGEMLRSARLRDPEARLVRADAHHLPHPSGAFDGLVSGFALRNFVDLAAVLAECARVLRPGGRLALLEVDAPRNRLLRVGHELYFSRVVPLLGRLLADADAYAYLPESVAYLPPETELLALVRRAGFDGVAKHSLLGGAAQIIAATRQPTSREPS